VNRGCIRILQKQSHWLTWACTAINNQQELNEAFENLIRNEDIRPTGTYVQHFCANGPGATTTIEKILQ
jgi:hypothetical protein